MKTNYLLALFISLNVGGLCASELSEFDEEVMEIHQQNHSSQNEKILRIVQMVSGVLGIMEGFHGSHKTLVTSASDARHKFYVRGAISLVSFLNGFVSLHRGFVGEDLRPEDTGLVKKVIAFLGLLSLKPFTTLNGATILWESFA